MTAGQAYVERWSRVGEAARCARAVPTNRVIALVVVLLYNVAGFADVATTVQGLQLGAAEANPLIRGFMDLLAHYWIVPKLLSQAAVTAMVLFFPHRYVCGIFLVAVLATWATVLNNLAVIGAL